VRVAPAVVLSPEERAVLLRWSRRNRRDDPRALRARIVLDAAAGLQDLEIAGRLGIDRLTAARWRRRFLYARLRGIDRPSPRLPRHGVIPEARIREILQYSGAATRTGIERVSTRTVARRVGVSHSTVRRLWNDHGVRPARIGTSPSRPDPTPPLEPYDVVGLFLSPPDFAVALALEPGTSGGARGAGIGGDLDPGGLATGWVAGTDVPLLAPPLGFVGSRSPRVRMRDFLRFAGEVEQATGRSAPVAILAVLPALTRSLELRTLRIRRPNVRLELSEEVGVWRSRVARELERIGRHGPGVVRGHGRSETTRAIGQFLSAYSEASGPFRWVASRSELDSSDAGARLRYDLSVTGHTGFKKAADVKPPVRAREPPDPRAREMARVVLRKCLRVRAGELVAVQSWSGTIEYANAFVLESLRLGARPLLLYQDEPTYWAAVTESPPSSLARVGDHLRAAIAKSDVLVTFFGPSDRERFHALPRAKMLRLSEYSDSLYSAAAKAGTRAVQIALGRASAASARMYGVDLATWKAELVAGTTVDPAVLHRRARTVARRLLNGRVLEIHHPNGTHLRLGLRHRRPQVSDGLVPPARPKGDWSFVQLPAGVVSVALDETVAEGIYHSNVRNSVGVFDTVAEVDGGRWTFSGGRLRHFAYDVGYDVFSQSFERGGPGKDRVGLLSVGLNDRISMSPLLLDQAAGALTLQLGRNDSVGGTNHVNWWAWLLLHGADLTVDGTAVVDGGKLVE
jgi:leucyl aminopeptidase (aminopeptidase T)